MELGKVQKLKIYKMTDNGARLGNEEDDVLLPKNEVEDGWTVGDEVEVFILRDSQERLIATLKRPIAQVGEIAPMRITDVNKYGAFADWGLGKELFVPFKEQKIKVRVNDVVGIRVYVDKSDRLAGSTRIYDYLEIGDFNEDDTVSGLVYEINPDMGAFVAVENKYHGMLPKNEMVKEVKIGDVKEFRIKKVREDGKLTLSLRNKSYIQMDIDAQKIVEYMENNGGELGFPEKSSPELIKAELGMSKAGFKRSIGRLLKEKRVKIGENNIFLIK